MNKDKFNSRKEKKVKSEKKYGKKRKKNAGNKKL